MKTTKEKNNFIQWNRNWVTVRRHLPIVLKPLIVGAVMACIWRFVLYSHGIYFRDFANVTIINIILPLVSFIYVIFAGIATTAVFNRYTTISRCVVKRDIDSFLLYRDEKLPIMMHILIGAPSIIIVIFIMLFDYDGHLLLGMSAILSVVFVLILIWVIATELDDFRKSIWFRVKIPEAWYTIDVDEYFHNKKTDLGKLS